MKKKAKTKAKTKAKSKGKGKAKVKASRKRSSVKAPSAKRVSAIKGGPLPAAPPLTSGISSSKLQSGMLPPAVQPLADGSV